MRPFHSISGGSDVRLERRVRGRSDAGWSEKAPLVTSAHRVIEDRVIEDNSML